MYHLDILVKRICKFTSSKTSTDVAASDDATEVIYISADFDLKLQIGNIIVV